MTYVVMTDGALQWMPNTQQAVGLITTYRKMKLDPECMMQTLEIEDEEHEGDIPW